ncbi:hypothetical protein Tsubulata_014565 [Turnera subulata]|uniref:Uncharacterized protein n=1 Tax=Turnera subulata TaxID=218843 RepID=A0A9Q0FI96_9ROSI|nr:hypothetical protein Tsubulata_014565 [Turnera subulata]
MHPILGIAEEPGKLTPATRKTWRKDSALRDGLDFGSGTRTLEWIWLVATMMLVTKVKFSFPMIFTATMLAWRVLEFGDSTEET